jgi:hypothetical protein
MLLNLLFNKFLDLGAVEVAVVDPTLPHSIKAIQHHTSIETLAENLLFMKQAIESRYICQGKLNKNLPSILL